MCAILGLSNRVGDRAALNMGVCFAYACAKANDMPLLYIGNDFSKTDVNAAFGRK